MIDFSKLICPFCSGTVRIAVCDDEGNFHGDEYQDDPWSGLGYKLIHDENDVPSGCDCPIATYEDENLGIYIYDSRKEAYNAWNSKLIGAKQ